VRKKIVDVYKKESDLQNGFRVVNLRHLEEVALYSDSEISSHQ
jgi:hypothetical protein